MSFKRLAGFMTALSLLHVVFVASGFACPSQEVAHAGHVARAARAVAPAHGHDCLEQRKPAAEHPVPAAPGVPSGVADCCLAVHSCGPAVANVSVHGVSRADARRIPRAAPGAIVALSAPNIPPDPPPPRA